MTPVIGFMFAAAGLAIGWAIGSAVAASHLRRRRVSKSMKDYNDLVKALSRTAGPTKETNANG
jgi:hypothetical protein